MGEKREKKHESSLLECKVVVVVVVCVDDDDDVDAVFLCYPIPKSMMMIFLSVVQIETRLNVPERLQLVNWFTCHSQWRGLVADGRPQQQGPTRLSPKDVIELLLVSFAY